MRAHVLLQSRDYYWYRWLSIREDAGVDDGKMRRGSILISIRYDDTSIELREFFPQIDHSIWEIETRDCFLEGEQRTTWPQKTDWRPALCVLPGCICCSHLIKGRLARIAHLSLHQTPFQIEIHSKLTTTSYIRALCLNMFRFLIIVKQKILKCEHNSFIRKMT